MAKILTLKHWILSLYLVLFINLGWVQAQNEISTEFYNRQNYIFGNLETNRVPHGLLQDFAFEFTDLNSYNGTVLADSNKVDPTAFWNIYRTLLTSRISTNAAAFANPESLEDTWFNLRQPGRITLAGLYYQYSRFRDDAVSSNRITINNDVIQDKYVSGTWQNPYQTHAVFAMGAAFYSYEGLNQEILLPASLWKTNNAGSISSIQVNAGNGLGYQTLNPGQSLFVSYPDTGQYVLTYKINLSNSASLYSHSQIHIRPSLRPQNISIARIGRSNPEILPMTATEAFNDGTFASGTITIHYADPDRGLRRPLIIAEGFDPGFILTPEAEFGMNTIDNFIENIESFNLRNMLDLDRTLEYDLVYVDWNRSTDDIRKNALLLKRIIRWVNESKEPLPGGGFAQNVVLGESMGGLAARWALRDMENNFENHQTRLYISLDSPHQGVNIPLGYQYLSQHLKQIYLKTGLGASMVEMMPFLTGDVSPKRALNLLNSTAPRQMVKNYIDSNYQLDNSVHNQWQDALETMGYPQGVPGQPFRKVAISNGAQCGTMQDLAPGGNLLSYNGKGNTRFLTDILSLVLSPVTGSVSTLGSLLTNKPGFLLGILPGRNDLQFDININALANGGGNQIYYNKIWYTKKILWLIPVNTYIANRVGTAPSGLLPFDSYGGGLYETPINFGNAREKNWFIKYNVTASNNPRFSFVPTPSALDVGSGNVALSNIDYMRAYIGGNPPLSPNNIPFDNFITAFEGASINEIHTTISPRNGNWIADELNGLTPTANCAECLTPNNLAISGPDGFCQTTTFSVPNLPAGFSVTWSFLETDNDFLFVGSNTGNSVTITADPNGDATDDIIASITSSCFTNPIVSQISIYGREPDPESVSNIEGPEGIEVGVGDSFAISEVPGATNYQWYAAEGGMSFTNLTKTGNYVHVNTRWPGQYNIGVIITVPCGYLYSEEVFVDAYGDEVEDWRFSVSPNPSTGDNVEVTAYKTKKEKVEKPENANNLKDAQILLYDKFSRLLSTYKFIEQKATIPTSNLPNDIYIINIINGKQIVKEKLIVSH